MPRPILLPLLLASALVAPAQVKHTIVPLADVLAKATAESSLTAPGSQPFHLRLTIAEPENPQSPYGGTLEEWWVSPQQWRRELTSKDGLHQLIVVHDGAHTEQDTGDYLPLWLRNFVTAVTDPIPDAAAWAATGATIDQTILPNGARSQACARAQSKPGTGDTAPAPVSSLCFSNDGHLSFYGSARYSMEFHDLRSFGKEQIARTLIQDPEPGTRLVGTVTLLEELSRVKNSDTLFAPLDRTDNRFATFPVPAEIIAKMSAGAPPIVWPPVHSGNVRGRLGMYLSVDTTGAVREAWPLNSDNAGLEDPARDQVRQWKLKPATDKAGNHVQVDGPIFFSFETHIGDPLANLSDTEVRALATHIVAPSFPAGSLTPGQPIDVQISVDEQGKVTGTGFTGVPSAAVGPLNEVLQQWTFKPLIKDGKPQYFHGTLHFVAP